jgi:tubulin epsilon
MEEGVLSQVMRGPQRHLFGATQFVRSVSGSGNNWAQGFAGYGPEYDAQLREGVRRLVERCESPQAFFVLHSLGGGTGSGLGTYLLELLADEFAETTRFVAAVCPSANDDVVTSPYNSTLALAKLIEVGARACSCALPS